MKNARFSIQVVEVSDSLLEISVIDIESVSCTAITKKQQKKPHKQMFTRL